jgi:hypothetical protein
MIKIVHTIILTFALILIASFYPLLAQYQNPPSIKWTQINTPHFQVVAPHTILTSSIEVANLLEAAYFPDGRTFNTHTRKLPVFLFNQSVISNGYTTLIPRHIGFYTTPPQDAQLVGGGNWLQLLTIHEFRHAVQFQKLDTNFTRYAGTLYGNMGKSFCMFASVPNWVFEGDAVCNETMYTNEGRGRMPSFTRDIMTLESEGRRYSYFKAYQGSFRNYIPDHYHLGYLMTAYIRKNYGSQTWNDILEYTTRYSFFPLAFMGGLRKYTHKSLLATYRNCLDEFRLQYAPDSAFSNYAEFEKLSHSNTKAYTQYSYPAYIDSIKVIALKKGFDDPPTIVLLENGKEKKLIEISPKDRIQTNGEYVVWASESADLRWGQRSYSDIYIYRIRSGLSEQLTHKGKFFAPSISPDGKTIAAIEYGEEMKCSLVLINTESLDKIAAYEFADGLFARMPSWSADGSQLVFTVTSRNGINISVFDLKKNSLNQITPFTNDNVSNPVFYKKYILFNSSAGGIDAIHALDTASLKRYVVLMSRYGAYNPSISPDDNSLVFQNYSINGFEIGMNMIDERQWQKTEDIPAKEDIYYKYLIADENADNIFDTLNVANREGFEVKKYSPLRHMLNVHSWAFYPVHNGVGLAIISNDYLSTTSAIAGINYFTQDEALREFLTISYGRFFPVFDLEISHGRNYQYFYSTPDTLDLYKINENVLSAGVSIPFDFSRNINTTTLSLGTSYKNISTHYVDPRTSEQNVTAYELSMEFRRSRQLTYRDLDPRFGQNLTVLYWKSLPTSAIDGIRLVAEGNIFLPGLAKHHSLKISGGYESSSHNFAGNIYKLTSDIEFIRGYDPVTYNKLVKGSIDYHFPLLYPDLTIGHLFYLKRINTNFFFDHGFAEFDADSRFYDSAGLDLNFEFNIFSIPMILWEVGIRYSYRLKDQGSKFNILFLGIPL